MAVPMPADSVLMEMVAMRGRAVFWEWKSLSILPQHMLMGQEADRILKLDRYFQANNHICGAYIKALQLLEVCTVWA